jgi:alkylation response protein AidB-like acyl-CoA dehydrogenase
MENFYTDNNDLKFHLSHPLMKRIVDLKERHFEDKNTFDYAPLDFEDAMDSYDKVIEIVGDISANIIAPNAESVDKEGPKIENGRVIYARGTSENHKALTNAGLIGMTLPRKYDGLNFPILPYIMAGEIISRADAGFANIWGLQDCAETIYEFADEQIKDSVLPRFHLGATAAMDLTEPDAGSDLQAVQLKAHFDEQTQKWYLNGVKRFITNGDAEISLVLARTEEGTSDGRGLSLFVFEREDKALTVRRIENKLGIKGSPTCELVFKNAEAKLVGERRMGLIKYVMALMNGARLGVGGQSVGIAEAAYREALKYAHEREQFGKPIIQFPAVYTMLTNMKAKLQAARSLLYETARFVDIYKALEDISRERKLDADERNELKNYKKLADMYTPLIKLMGSEYSNEIAYDSLQIHGGTGFMKDFPIERIFRDARITTIYEGTSQLQVVAAIKGVSTGVFAARMNEYAEQITHPEFEYLKRQLKEMQLEFQEAANFVNNAGEPEFVDFHARRLVEMAGNLVMSYLLLLDSLRNEQYKNSAFVFIKMADSQNKERYSFIIKSELKDIGLYKLA